jgi:hypothetical protein
VSDIYVSEERVKIKIVGKKTVLFATLYFVELKIIY